MNVIKLTTQESEAVERAYYEASSYESLVSVLCRNLSSCESPDAAQILRHYSDLLRISQMKLRMAQDMVLSNHISSEDAARAVYRFDFVREEAIPLETKKV